MRSNGRPWQRNNCRRPATDAGSAGRGINRPRTSCLPQSSCLAEKVDEQESDDAQGTGGRAAVDAGDDASAKVGRSGSVSNGIAVTGNDVAASDGDPDQVTDAETHVAGRQEDQRPFRISATDQEFD